MTWRVVRHHCACKRPLDRAAARARFFRERDAAGARQEQAHLPSSTEAAPFHDDYSASWPMWNRHRALRRFGRKP